MNKVVCNVCGTSYPENSPQCPICGYVRSAETSISAENTSERSYTYVKGGRFSKANVKKRNQANQKNVTATKTTPKQPVRKKSEQGTTGLIIIVVVLLLAIVAVIAYIALRFFVPNDFLYEGLDGFTLPAIHQTSEPAEDPTDSTPESTVPVACTSIVINATQLELKELGGTYNLRAVASPANTTDVPVFSSSDPAVASVSSTGLITYVGEGSAVITVTCGTVSAQCNVTCAAPTTEPVIELVLNRKEIVFDAAGQSWMLYDGTIEISDIVWSSDDNTIATITDGKVFAVAEGSTTVYGIYQGQIVTCNIICEFKDEEETQGSISEADGDDSVTYSLFNPYGYSDDVSIRVGERFPLMLVDENENEVENATWKVKNERYCSYNDGIVKGLAVGTTEVTATYEGITYTCIVRVKE